MGGYGSGRSGGKQTTGDMLRLEVRSLHRDGVFDAGKAGLITWTRWADGKSSVSFQGLGHALKLVFRVRVNGGEWQAVQRRVQGQAPALAGLASRSRANLRWQVDRG